MTNNPSVTDTSHIAKGRVGPVFAGNVTFESVGYHVDGKTILQDVSLTIRAGRVACLLGPSGCGKTTLLKLAAGVIAPTSGRITLDGVEVAGPNRFVPPEKRNVGLMFQDFALFPHLTALQNVAYGLYALKKSDALRIAELALQRVGLGALAQHYPSALSGGEQQRVALARAIVPRPQVILMDEPFSGLDQRMRDSIRDDTLGVVRETQATTLLVTHDPIEALAFSDDIFIMRSGRLVQAGTPGDVLQRPLDAEVAQMLSAHTVFQGIVRDGVVQTPLGDVKARADLEGLRVDVLVPPHGIVVSRTGTPATIVELRDLGSYQRIVARIDAHENPILIHSHDYHLSVSDENRLALTGRDAHIFPSANVMNV
jgi:iron(III) transport system ATP-binding protein